MNKNIGKALSALTLIIAGSSGVAMANDIAAANVSPTAGSLAHATAIQFDEFTATGLAMSSSLASVPVHTHNHDNDYAAGLVAANTRGASFDV